jgi:DNA-binding MarR family transcriptional regulator
LPSIRPTSELSSHLGYWLRYVSNHVSQAFARKVEAHGVTVAEWVLMRQLLEVEALAPSRLAERMGMTRGAVSKLADRLIAKSLLLRTANPEDGRAQTLSLTRAAARWSPSWRRWPMPTMPNSRSPAAEGPRGAAQSLAGDRREARLEVLARRLKTHIPHPHHNRTMR